MGRSILRFVSVTAATAALLVSGTEIVAASASVGQDRVRSPRKTTLQLTDNQRRIVADAVGWRDTNDRLPAGFNPAVGATIPAQAKLPSHPVPPPATDKIPALKNYYYAKLSDKILLIDPMTRKVTDVIPNGSSFKSLQ